MHTEGITAITAGDFAAADTDGYVIKLRLFASASGENGANIRVNPTLILVGNSLAGV